jgi:hypothetical protein
MGLTLVGEGEDGATLEVQIVETLMAVKSSELGLPVLPVKLGSYKVSVGPFLNPLLTAEHLKEHLAPGKRLYEDEGFLISDSPMQGLSLQLVSAEILNTVVQAGSYDTIRSIVEWNSTTLRRLVWPI